MSVNLSNPGTTVIAIVLCLTAPVNTHSSTSVLKSTELWRAMTPRFTSTLKDADSMSSVMVDNAKSTDIGAKWTAAIWMSAILHRHSTLPTRRIRSLHCWPLCFLYEKRSERKLESLAFLRSRWRLLSSLISHQLRDSRSSHVLHVHRYSFGIIKTLLNPTLKNSVLSW